MQLTVKNFFKDKNGKVVLGQKPNFLIYTWAVLVITSWLINSEDLKENLGQLGTAVLFAWAYLEATAGVNYFRKSLGLIILAATAINFFN